MVVAAFVMPTMAQALEAPSWTAKILSPDIISQTGLTTPNDDQRSINYGVGFFMEGYCNMDQAAAVQDTTTLGSNETGEFEIEGSISTTVVTNTASKVSVTVTSSGGSGSLLNMDYNDGDSLYSTFSYIAKDKDGNEQGTAQAASTSQHPTSVNIDRGEEVSVTANFLTKTADNQILEAGEYASTIGFDCSRQ